MARTYSEIISLVNSKLQQVGGSISGSNMKAAANLALDALLMRLDFAEQEKTQTLSPFFKGVNSYSCPTDLKGNAILNLRPYPSGDRMVNTEYDHNTRNEFDRNLFWEDATGKFAIEHNGATKILRLNLNSDTSTNYTLHDCNAYNANGTWTVGAGTTSVETDEGIYTEGSGSIKWTASADTAIIENTTLDAVNISGVASGKSYIFMDLYLTSSVSSVTLKWGNDASNYYYKTETTDHLGQAFVAGWNTIKMDIQSATETGAVDDTSIDYLNLSLTGTSLSSQIFRVDNIVLRDGGLYEIKYLSKNVVLAVSGTAKQYFTADDDTLVCNEDGEAVYIDWLTGYLAPNIKDSYSNKTFLELATDSIKNYKRMYPSERKAVRRNYYGY
jgi:hypothetical protein